VNSFEIKDALASVGLTPTAWSLDPKKKAFEYELSSGDIFYIKRNPLSDKDIESGAEEKPTDQNPIVIHPNSLKLKNKIDVIDGLSSIWKPSKNSNFREFPKFEGNKSQYGFDLFTASEKAIIKLIELISGNELHLDIAKNTVVNSSLTDKIASEESIVFDEVTLRAIKTRRGQDKFRKSLLTAFNDTCCVTGSTVISVLEAAHIISHSDDTNYKVTNGILLRADIHTLFDLNLIGIDQHGVVHTSNELEQSEYSGYQGVVVASSLSEDTVVNLKKRFVEYIEKNSLN
jgi:hypothetical protein